jgi:hypothetical protein
VVRHIDGNPLNNTWDNIEIGTASENMMDIPKEIRIATATNASFSRKAKYSEEKILKIKELHKNGWSYKEIMKELGISSKGTISYIVKH